ncbi:hypothetical protein ACSBPH_15575 [Microbacterium sp. F51-2R]|jgi:hypothetical protein|uniref:hypothetical protein n=1 Tax=Microbacterium sp. F51-2R TaxID=3445777 RepID=UPI003FA14D71
MSDPTQPMKDDDDQTLAGAVADAVAGHHGDEPVDEDLNADEIDSAEADAQAAREGTKGDTGNA